MNGFIRGPLTAAASVAVMFTLGVGGIAFAETPDTDVPAECGRISLSLAEAKSDATLPVNIGGTTLTSVNQVESMLEGLPADVEAVAETRAQLQAVLDATAEVDVLQAQLDTCIEENQDNGSTTEPTPTDEPATPAAPSDDNTSSDIDGVTGGPSNSSSGNSQFEYTPSTAPETGRV